MAATNIEIFAPVEGYADRFISNMGRFRGSRGNINRTYFTSSGEEYVRISKDYVYPVSHLVARAFLPAPVDKMMQNIVHVNGNRSDNRARNLRWSYDRDEMVGAQLKGVAEVSRIGRVLRIWHAVSCAAAELGVCRNSIYNHLYGLSRNTGGRHFLERRHRSKRQ